MLRQASLGRRLLLGAGAFVALALVFSAFVIGFILHHFVQAQIDQRLDTQVIFLGSLLHADAEGRLTVSGATDGPPFDRPGRGWYWQVTGPRNTLRSASLEGRDLALPDMPVRPPHPPPPPPRDAPLPPVNPPRPADGPGPDGRPLHFRVQHASVDGAAVTIVASAPRSAVRGPLVSAMLTLALSLAVLGIALMAAMWLQVRLGLRPLDRLRQSIAHVRAGRLDRVPETQPAEVLPLVTEVNALLEQNATNLERARAHVANLAHGLKTPLATLALALAERRQARGGEAQDLSLLTDLMQWRIRHHLGRARMAAQSGPARMRTAVGPRIGDLVAVMQKIHAERAIAVTTAVAPDLAVACEPQDFDEMAGNLLDNAFKWARRQVRVTAQHDGARSVLLTIADDGPGVPAHQLDEIVQRGARLDESAPGFGFGLPIARELAELYGGDLTLTSENGLSVTLRLPAV
jgi:signal transduction histidine kinase